MPNADLIVPTFVDQKILLEGRFRITDHHAGRETAIGGLNVSESMVDANDILVCKCSHIFPPVLLLPSKKWGQYSK